MPRPLELDPREASRADLRVVHGEVDADDLRPVEPPSGNTIVVIRHFADTTFGRAQCVNF